jgi:hypothetical protein
MSKLATRDISGAARTRRTVAAIAASAVVLIVVATASPTRQARPSVTRRASKPDAAGKVTRDGSNASSKVAARTFLTSYVAFLYGRRDGAAVTPVGPRLHQRLLGAQSIPTPAELTRALVVRDVTVSPNASGTAVGTAVIDDGASPPYALTFDLSFSHLRWLVTSVQREGR